MRLRVVLAAALAVVGAAGIFLGTRSDDDPMPIERVMPPVVRAATVTELRRCRREQQDKRVRFACPTVFPTPGGFERARQFGSDACESLVNFEPAGARLESGSVFHMLVGARCGAMSLATARKRWPVDISLERDMRLIGRRSATPAGRRSAAVRLAVLRRTTIDGRPTLVLRNPPYPDGGIHGGHLTVLTTSATTTYAITGHPPIPANLQDEAGELIALEGTARVLPHERRAVAQLLEVAARLAVK